MISIPCIERFTRRYNKILVEDITKKQFFDIYHKKLFIIELFSTKTIVFFQQRILLMKSITLFDYQIYYQIMFNSLSVTVHL